MPRYKKNHDGYYRVNIDVGKNPDGKRIRVAVRAKSVSELEARIGEIKKLHVRGISLDEITVADWATRWLAVYKANATTTQKAHYKVKVEKDILPIIGHMMIRDVRPSHLQELLNGYEGGKTSTIEKIKQAIQQLFADAEVEGLIVRSPATRLELPSTSELVRRPLTDVERFAVWKVAQSHKAGVYVLAMLFCGLRRGETLALRVSDVDFQHRRISVTKSLFFDGNVGFEKDPKSEAGIREVPIPDVLVPFLQTQCQGKGADDLLFTKTNGDPVTQQTCKWWWKSFLRQCHIAAGAKLYRNAVVIEESPFADYITPHYLRHTYATDLYAAGVDEKAQKSFLGHASSDVTDIYRQMNEAAFQRALAALNEYYESLVSDEETKRRHQVSNKRLSSA